ncbi:hypothetical protein NLI96_g11513 [Meripilus lineatus]|uniref:DUF6535 domain-containing protein n=1 Tax=Meripilus lineatus TaxID=2056292 RepID=A0AAD5URM7_9APHY|nr:hypothetical protein NLI96_g11513 [Physisporinus lineatus]
MLPFQLVSVAASDPSTSRLPLPLKPSSLISYSHLYHLVETLPASMSALIDPTSHSIESTDIPLKTVPTTSSQNPEAGPSSEQNDQAKGSMENEIPGPQNSSRRSSVDCKGKNIDMTFKGKTLTELKKEFEEKCAEIDKECPEIVRKEKGNRWNEIHNVLKDRDAKAIQNHYENIDTLLVFAGLYSAILTAFVVEAYKLLQRDSSDASLQVLIQISQQLGSFAVTPGFANATHVPLSLPTGAFIPDRSSVWLNGLWFVALILSLVTASLGMLVKQWLREYLNLPDVKPEAQRRIQLFRVRGLRKYKVSEIAAFLPLLLQISLILFFSGLVLFTRSVHATIGWVITGFVVAWGAFLVITTILPWFSASCPYKTPFFKPITLQFKRLLANLIRPLGESSFYPFCWLHWKSYNTLFADDTETRASRDRSLDGDVLIDAYKTSGNADVWETVMYCAVDPQDPSTSLTRLPSVTNRRHFPDEMSMTLTDDAWRRLSGVEAQLFVKNLATCIRLRLIQAFEKKEHSELGDHVVDSLLQLDKYRCYVPWDSTGVGRALEQLSTLFLQGALSVTFAPGSLVKYASGLLGRGVRTLRILDHFSESAMSAFIEASNEFFEQTGTSNSEYDRKVMTQCGSIIFCAGRATEESRALLEHEFPQLSRHIASKVKSLPDPSGLQYPPDVFECHCVLDMAMRLHKRIPDIIDKTLLEALYTRSVKMFDLYVEWYMWLQEHIKGKPEGVSQRSGVSIGTIDWDQVLKEYTEIEVRDVGEYTEYGDEWDYQRLRVDCKHRMEFMLNYEKGWAGDEIRKILSAFQS